MKTVIINKTKVKIFEEKELKEQLKMNDTEIRIVLEYQRLFPELLQLEGKGFCIDARNLHSKLVENVKVNKTGDKFSQWIKRRIDKYNFEKNIDFISVHKNVNGRFSDEEINRMTSQKRSSYGISTEYTLTLDMAKQLCMIENNERGNLCRRYFIIIERTFREHSDWIMTRLDEKQNANILKSNLGEWASRELDCYDIKAICARESNMINKNLTGNTALEIKLKLRYLDKITRNHLTKEINESINYIQEFDINLLECNIDFETRNNMILNICNSKYKKLKEEFNK